MELTNQEKSVIALAMERLNVYYEEKIETVRKFKWICHDHLPQHGEGYEANKNVFEIQDKTLRDLEEQRRFAVTTLNKILDQK